jgi:hypothetical protein
MRRRVAGLVALACVVTACVVTACSTTVNGTGHGSQRTPQSRQPSSSGPDFSGSPTSPTGAPLPSGSEPAPTPTGSGTSTSGPPPTTTCPHISYPYAHLAFDCAAAGLEIGTTPDPVWPVNLSKAVEATWAMSEGAGHWGAAEGQSLEAIATNVRTQMLTEDPPAYGTSPTVQTTSSSAATVAGVGAWVLQTTFTLNPAFRKGRSLKVNVEKSWIVAMKVGDDDISLWYVTIPDDVSTLWAQVPALMDTIKVI